MKIAVLFEADEIDIFGDDAKAEMDIVGKKVQSMIKTEPIKKVNKYNGHCLAFVVVRYGSVPNSDYSCSLRIWRHPDGRWTATYDSGQQHPPEGTFDAPSELFDFVEKGYNKVMKSVERLKGKA
jgi:hypothetical protein